MIYKVMAYLFRNDDNSYHAKPHHLIWSLLFMAVGVVTFTYDDWHLFGVCSFILGSGLGVIIVLGMLWDKVTEYWSTLDSFANTMMKSNNPDLWMALGFKVPPSQVMITETKEADNDGGYSMKIHRIPVSPAVMQSIADKVLLSGNTDFIETNFSNIPNIRKVRNHLKAEGLLSPKNKKNVRLGYTFNRKGIDSLYQYASEGIRLELKRR